MRTNAPSLDLTGARNFTPRLRDSLRREQPRSLYIHIPFCGSRCFYCDFTTYVAPSAAVDAYLERLAREFEMIAPGVREPLQTVFFGGGTPTLPSAAQLQRLLRRLRDSLPIASDAEITMEANPGTVNEEKLGVLREGGVNRLSYGAQTFEPRLLMAVGRLHDVDAIYRSVVEARSAGFSQISLDLMFGLPEQSLDDLDRTLRAAQDLAVPHLSAYWLKVEPGTPFAAWQKQGLLPLPGEDIEGDMYDRVRETLKGAGYRHYEVSNFAKPGHEARHNLVYWRNQPYFAAGVAAHGYAYGERTANVTTLAGYAADVDAGRRPIAEKNTVSVREACEDTMMLGLRLAEGVSRVGFAVRHGTSMEALFGGEMARLTNLGLVELAEGRLRLTNRAWPVANAVFEAFVGTE